MVEVNAQNVNVLSNANEQNVQPQNVENVRVLSNSQNLKFTKCESYKCEQYHRACKCSKMPKNANLNVNVKKMPLPK